MGLERFNDGLVKHGFYALLCHYRCAAGPVVRLLGAHKIVGYRSDRLELAHCHFRSYLELLVLVCHAARCRGGRGNVCACLELDDRGSLPIASTRPRTVFLYARSPSRSFPEFLAQRQNCSFVWVASCLLYSFPARYRSRRSLPGNPRTSEGRCGAGEQCGPLPTGFSLRPHLWP